MNKPMIRFEGYNEGWEKVKLGEIASFHKGKGLRKSDVINGPIDGSYTPAILYGELYTTYENDIVLVKSAVAQGVINKPVISEGNEILIPSSSTSLEDAITVSALHVPGVILGSDINIIRPNETLNNSFASMLMNGKMHHDLFSLLESTTISHLYNSSLKGLYINKPSCEEQEQIGNLFKTLDDLISAEEDSLCYFEQYKEAMLQKMFPKKGRKVPEVRFEGYDEVWEEVKLGDFISLMNGYSFKSSSYIDEGEYKILTISNVQGDQYVDTSEVNTITSLPDNIRDHQRLDIGDVLISMTGNVGRVSMVNEGNTLLNQRVGLMSFNKDSDVDKQFIFYVLRDSKFEYGMMSKGQGAAQLNIGKSDIEGYNLQLPSIEEQVQIGNFFKALDDKIELQQKHVEDLQEVKGSFLQKMFV